jgi:uncharacterized membrane-anchored protein
MSLFEEHPLRKTLNDEVHARPPVALQGSELVTYLAFLHENGSADRELDHLRLLAQQLGLTEPASDAVHLMLEANDFRLKWERHSEFSSYTFFRRAEVTPSADNGVLLAVPTTWRKAIPGRLIVASHVEVRKDGEAAAEAMLESLGNNERNQIVSRISEGAGWVSTDFRLHDGFSRFTLIDASLTPRQAGRTVQRLLEVETYRVMALLAFPVAKEVGRLVSQAEVELADLMDSIGEARSSEDERLVLGRLTRLAADVERSVARTTYRFGAAAAYYRLVRQRIDELREVRVAGFPPIREFMERRLAPAMATCETMARRQEELSGRIARNSQLLRTRVDIELERQNQALLEQMNQRAKLQLRLQETVEGLSIVAITYYGSQLIHYLAKGGQAWIAPFSAEMVTAVSIPVIAITVFIGLGRMRRSVAAEAQGIEH